MGIFLVHNSCRPCGNFFRAFCRINAPLPYFSDRRVISDCVSSRRVWTNRTHSDGQTSVVTARHASKAAAASSSSPVQRAPLETAVAGFREALKERTRKRVPLAWAATQMNLGSELSLPTKSIGNAHACATSPRESPVHLRLGCAHNRSSWIAFATPAIWIIGWSSSAIAAPT
jgi:hypothetical protein